MNKSWYYLFHELLLIFRVYLAARCLDEEEAGDGNGGNDAGEGQPDADGGVDGGNIVKCKILKVRTSITNNFRLSLSAMP